ncbi:MAG: hypothetical protein HY958_03405 [Bacteroidia bacterium]|nr:hypothetical protein [Bacteroidia bacterium]
MNLLKPHRKFEMSVHIGADSKQEIINALNFMASDIKEDSRNSRDIITGNGIRSGWSLKLDFYPDQEHEKYIKEIDKYLEAVII